MHERPRNAERVRSRAMRYLPLTVSFLVLACGGKAETATDQAPSSTGGTSGTGGGESTEESVPVECQNSLWRPTPNGCVDIDECATPGACGTNMQCTNLEGGYKCECLPGFIDLGPNCVAPTADTCAALAQDICPTVAGCTDLTAQRFAANEKCVEPLREWVGCGALGCGGAYSRAIDPEGRLWYFPSTCHPIGWVDAGLQGADECSGVSTCAGLNEAECSAAGPCEPVFGWRSDSDSSAYIGCRTTASGDQPYVPCGATITCAHPGGSMDGCIRFGTTCHPDGWESATCGEADCPAP
jgi:hypothetical protein